MKKIFKQIHLLICSFMLLVFASCNKDFLNTEPKNAATDNVVWSTPELAVQFINNIYLGIPYPHQWLMGASLVDEAVFIQTDQIATRVTDCQLTSDQQGALAQSVWAYSMQDWNWANAYSRVRACNLALEKLGDVPFPSEDTRSELRGELYFLRGFYYYLLTTQYGGVPIIDFTYESTNDFNIARNSYEDCINFIVKDLDSADILLPLNGDKTRGTKGAALALKSRVLLYAASDLHNPAKNGAVTNGYAHPELLGYTGGDANARWQAAKNAAKAVIDLGIYSLYKGDPDPAINFENVFLKRSDEEIFLQYYDKVHFPYYATDWTGTVCQSVGYNGFGLNQITGNLADAFEHSDGTKFSWSNAADKANPYANRDPRFYATILYDGATWQSRASTNNKMQPGYWPQDNTQGPDWASFSTGYYLRKFLDINFQYVYFGTRPDQPWVHLRYAEILLNYAEACIALGQEDEARTYINMIRTRAGMPAVTDAGQNLINRLRNERRVELAWEERRIWDVRRWMIADQAYVPATGIDVQYHIDNGVHTTDDPLYTPKVVEPNRNWKNSHYFIPIARDEMNKNNLLVQNPGY